MTRGLSRIEIEQEMNPILSTDESFAVVADQLSSSTPAAVGKLGTIEFQLVQFAVMTRKQNLPIPSTFLLPLTRNAGMFPPTQETAKEMADLLLRAVMEMTAVSPWYKPEEECALYNIFNRKAARVALQGLECFLSPDPAHWWTARLAPGTRVLVISPFSSTIRAQIPHLDKIWAARPGLWSSQLQFHCIGFPLSFGIQSPEEQRHMLTAYGNSVGLLRAIQEEMDKVEYDIAIVGVGIHSLPLVAHAKRSGKRAIHTGGGTQIYFGIRGGRWDTMEPFTSFYNEHWVRPAAEERPPYLGAVEGGCYW
jgi:hypothetical protein